MNRKGFTLIELLVVVAVLALLASIVFSNLGGAREGARISNALSFQSQTHSLLGSDLVGWWNFNEGSGTTARDISGYDNHGTIVGATYVDGVPGTGGSALDFDGVGDYVRMTKNYNFDNFTFFFWTKAPTQTKNYEMPFSLIGDSTARIQGDTSDRTIGYFYLIDNSGNSSGYVSFPGLFNDVWIHIAGVIEGSDIHTYINGKYHSSRNDRFTDSFSFSNLYIGSRAINSYHYGGIIDDVRIYSRALTASEIQTLYAQTKDNYLAND